MSLRPVSATKPLFLSLLAALALWPAVDFFTGGSFLLFNPDLLNYGYHNFLHLSPIDYSWQAGRAMFRLPETVYYYPLMQWAADLSFSSPADLRISTINILLMAHLYASVLLTALLPVFKTRRMLLILLLVYSGPLSLVSTMADPAFMCALPWFLLALNLAIRPAITTVRAAVQLALFTATLALLLSTRSYMLSLAALVLCLPLRFNVFIRQSGPETKPSIKSWMVFFWAVLTMVIFNWPVITGWLASSNTFLGLTPPPGLSLDLKLFLVPAGLGPNAAAWPPAAAVFFLLAVVFVFELRRRCGSRVIRVSAWRYIGMWQRFRPTGLQLGLICILVWSALFKQIWLTVLAIEVCILVFTARRLRLFNLVILSTIKKAGGLPGGLMVLRPYARLFGLLFVLSLPLHFLQVQILPYIEVNSIRWFFQTNQALLDEWQAPLQRITGHDEPLFRSALLDCRLPAGDFSLFTSRKAGDARDLYLKQPAALASACYLSLDLLADAYRLQVRTGGGYSSLRPAGLYTFFSADAAHSPVSLARVHRPAFVRYLGFDTLITTGRWSYRLTPRRSGPFTFYHLPNFAADTTDERYKGCLFTPGPDLPLAESIQTLQKMNSRLPFREDKNSQADANMKDGLATPAQVSQTTAAGNLSGDCSLRWQQSPEQFRLEVKAEAAKATHLLVPLTYDPELDASEPAGRTARLLVGARQPKNGEAVVMSLVRTTVMWPWMVVAALFSGLLLYLAGKWIMVRPED